jgi:hypothetical protein
MPDVRLISNGKVLIFPKPSGEEPGDEPVNFSTSSVTFADADITFADTTYTP